MDYASYLNLLLSYLWHYMWEQWQWQYVIVPCGKFMWVSGTKGRLGVASHRNDNQSQLQIVTCVFYPMEVWYTGDTCMTGQVSHLCWFTWLICPHPDHMCQHCFIRPNCTSTPAKPGLALLCRCRLVGACVGLYCFVLADYIACLHLHVCLTLRRPQVIRHLFPVRLYVRNHLILICLSRWLSYKQCTLTRPP